LSCNNVAVKSRSNVAKIAKGIGCSSQGVNKVKEEYKTIDEYIKTFPAGIQSILEKMRLTIRKVVPEAAEAISYRMPTFKLKR
jgi:signal recognition particle GTPase